MPPWPGRDPLYGKRGKNLMKTDVRETENSYELDVDLPGFKKDEINVDLQDGYLTIQAAKGLDKDQQDKEGRYIRQERYAGACSRSFFVGDVEPNQVSAKYEDGILKISLPKQDKKELPSSHHRHRRLNPVLSPISARGKFAAGRFVSSGKPKKHFGTDRQLSGSCGILRTERSERGPSGIRLPGRAPWEKWLAAKEAPP